MRDFGKRFIDYRKYTKDLKFCHNYSNFLILYSRYYSLNLTYNELVIQKRFRKRTWRVVVTSIRSRRQDYVHKVTLKSLAS